MSVCEICCSVLHLIPPEPLSWGQRGGAGQNAGQQSDSEKRNAKPIACHAIERRHCEEKSQGSKPKSMLCL